MTPQLDRVLLLAADAGSDYQLIIGSYSHVGSQALGYVRYCPCWCVLVAALTRWSAGRLIKLRCRRGSLFFFFFSMAH